jgi:hypothetical protein
MNLSLNPIDYLPKMEDLKPIEKIMGGIMYVWL